MSGIVLHGYWRSSAAYRVRIALALKGVKVEHIAHNLRTGAQHGPEYLAIAPHGLVPAIEAEGTVLLESPAILEWIEARWSRPALLPPDPLDAARVRAIAALISCDIHPLNNLRVLDRLRDTFHASEAQVSAWLAHWTHAGFAPLEQLLAASPGPFAWGSAPTLADCCLVPQAYNAERYGLDLAPYPRIRQAVEAARALPAFQAAHPDRQPDADAA